MGPAWPCDGYEGDERELFRFPWLLHASTVGTCTFAMREAAVWAETDVVAFDIMAVLLRLGQGHGRYFWSWPYCPTGDTAGKIELES